MEKIFESCDISGCGMVTVSALISCVTNSAAPPNVDQSFFEEILNETKNKLDPLGQDVRIDKTAWVSAWSDAMVSSQQDEELRDGIDSDEGSVFNSSSCSGGPLDQSKRSYTFSPSRMSSTTEQNDDSKEEVKSLHHQINCLQERLRHVESQLQTSEYSLMSEEKKNHEQKEVICRLNNRIKSLGEDRDELMSSLAFCENDKKTLSSSLKKNEERLREMKNVIDEKDAEIACLRSELSEICERELSLKKENDILKRKLSSSDDQLQLMENHLQKKQADIENCIADKEEMSALLSQVQWEKNFLSNHCEELSQQAIYYPVHTAEISLANASNESEDVTPPRVWSQTTPTVETSTPLLIQKPQSQSMNSLWAEMKDMGSFISRVSSENSIEENGRKMETEDSVLTQSQQLATRSGLGSLNLRAGNVKGEFAAGNNSSSVKHKLALTNGSDQSDSVQISLSERDVHIKLVDAESQTSPKHLTAKLQISHYDHIHVVPIECMKIDAYTQTVSLRKVDKFSQSEVILDKREAKIQDMLSVVRHVQTCLQNASPFTQGGGDFEVPDSSSRVSGNISSFHIRDASVQTEIFEGDVEQPRKRAKRGDLSSYVHSTLSMKEVIKHHAHSTMSEAVEQSCSSLTTLSKLKSTQAPDGDRIGKTDTTYWWWLARPCFWYFIILLLLNIAVLVFGIISSLVVVLEEITGPSVIPTIYSPPNWLRATVKLFIHVSTHKVGPI